MTVRDSRREFLRRGAAATAGMLAAGTVTAQEGPEPHESVLPNPAESAAPTPQTPAAEQPKDEEELPDELREYSRFRPSYGGPVESDTYLGKLVPGRRAAELGPVAFEAPDLGKLSWKMVDGRKEFHIVCEHVSREFLPGNWMDVWGFNGSMPGPTIEVTQGDRVRFVVHNELPEPTSIHWHGLELPITEDGVPGLTQDPIQPGKTYVYEYDLHQAGTFFYHSHMPMQEAFGMVGFFIIHPQVAFDPPVDRDIGLIFQNFHIMPNQTVADSMAMDWNWHTINGRSGPYTTPMVVRHGERVRIRIMDFSPQQHHPIHLHGHTFWLTGTEGGRIPHSAWVPHNTVLHGVAEVKEFEFVAFNPGDWLMHCHMVHHMMNHMVRQVGPRIREGDSTLRYKRNIDNRPVVKYPHTDPGFGVTGYPQMMQSQGFTPEEMEKLNARRETRGMRKMWHMGVKALMTVVRVLPDDLYDLVMSSDEPVKPGQVFDEIARRRGKA